MKLFKVNSETPCYICISLEIGSTEPNSLAMNQMIPTSLN